MAFLTDLYNSTVDTLGRLFGADQDSVQHILAINGKVTDSDIRNLVQAANNKISELASKMRQMTQVERAKLENKINQAMDKLAQLTMRSGSPSLQSYYSKIRANINNEVKDTQDQIAKLSSVEDKITSDESDKIKRNDELASDLMNKGNLHKTADSNEYQAIKRSYTTNSAKLDNFERRMNEND